MTTRDDTAPAARRGGPAAEANLAVVAGDTLTPKRDARAPWSGQPSRGGGERSSRRSGGAPFGFVPLAVIAVLFLAMPLVALVIRAPWGHLLSDLSAPGVLDGAAPLSGLLAGAPSSSPCCSGCRSPGCWRGCRSAAATWCAPSSCCPWCCRRSSAASPCCSPSGATAWSARCSTSAFGITLPFTTAGAIMAETFVAMPFLVITVEAGIRAMDRRYEDAAATLGAGRWTVFRRVTLPLIAPVAGRRRRPGVGPRPRRVRRHHHLRRQPARARTQTMPLAVYLALQNDPDSAIALSLVMLAISLTVLVALRSRWFPGR